MMFAEQRLSVSRSVMSLSCIGDFFIFFYLNVFGFSFPPPNLVLVRDRGRCDDMKSRTYAALFDSFSVDLVLVWSISLASAKKGLMITMRVLNKALMIES